MRAITVTIPVDQAQALVDAANCNSDVAEGNLENVREIWSQQEGPDMREANRLVLQNAQTAQQAAQTLRDALREFRERDPLCLEIRHWMRMCTKYGGAREAMQVGHLPPLSDPDEPGT